MRWLDLRGILFCASIAGEHCSAARAGLRKRRGYRKGFPDVCIYQAPPKLVGKVGFAIELKSPLSRSQGTPEQKRWLKRLAQNGWVTGVFRGADKAIYALEAAGY